MPTTDSRRAVRDWSTGSSTLVRIGAMSAIIGGGFWTVKGVSILLTGVQPPLLFEVAPVLFALALLGLYACLGERGGIPRLVGLVLACGSGVLAIAGLASTTLSTSGDEFSPLVFGSFLANLGSLVFLGIATRRARAIRGRWSFLPLAMGLSTFPLIAVGGALESINERLLEPPLAIIGLARIWMGCLLWSSGGSRVERVPAA